MRASIVISILLSVHFAWAWPPTFGSEFNFTNTALIKAGKAVKGSYINTKENEAAQKAFRDRVQDKCGLCLIESITDKYGLVNYRIHHPDGWWFNIALDQWVVEVQMSPSTLEEIQTRKPEIQSLIFDTAKDIGLYSEDTAGHLHLGLESTFAQDPLLFRNFVVDWVMHSEMAFKIFGATRSNAPTIDMLGFTPMRNFKILIDQFDQHILKQRNTEVMNQSWFQKNLNRLQNKLTSHPPQNYFVGITQGAEITELVNAITTYVYYTTPAFSPPQKHQSLNLDHEETAEIRSVHEIQSADEFEHLARLIQGRLEYLKTIKTSIPFTGIKHIWTKQQAIDLFYEYAQKSGAHWSDVMNLVTDRYSKKTPKAVMSCPELF